MSHDLNEQALQAEIVGLRDLLTQAGLDAALLLEKAGIDATENEAARRLQRLLLEELHHRVKNTLATVMAITSQSLRNAETLEQGRAAVESRLFALGRAHDVLMQANWGHAQLSDVVRAAVEPFDQQAPTRFSLQGVSMDIAATAVLPIALSLNELCTNAVKYGALSKPSGRVEIAVAEDRTSQRVRLTWTETGGPKVDEPRRRSFGTRLLNRLAEQMGGHAIIRYEPEGMIYQFDVPALSLRAKAD